MPKKQRRFVPRVILTAACATTVVPVCAVGACGGKTAQTTGRLPDGGVAAGGAYFVGATWAGVAADAFGAGGTFSVGASAFGGSFSVGAGGFGGRRGVAAAGFGDRLGVGAGGFGGGGVAAGGFGSGGVFVAAAGFRGGVAAGGFGGPIRDSGADAPNASGGHAALDPDVDDAFGELGAGAPKGKPRIGTATRRRT